MSAYVWTRRKRSHPMKTILSKSARLYRIIGTGITALANNVYHARDQFLLAGYKIAINDIEISKK